MGGREIAPELGQEPGALERGGAPADARPVGTGRGQIRSLAVDPVEALAQPGGGLAGSEVLEALCDRHHVASGHEARGRRHTPRLIERSTHVITGWRSDE
jgi:hypothetical protein